MSAGQFLRKKYNERDDAEIALMSLSNFATFANDREIYILYRCGFVNGIEIQCYPDTDEYDSIDYVFLLHRLVNNYLDWCNNNNNELKKNKLEKDLRLALSIMPKEWTPQI